MKILEVIINAVVLWTLVESRHVGRDRRSLEGKGSNLTQRHNLGVVHSDGLQHFTTPPSGETSTGSPPPSLTKDLPFLPEDIQSLKNDDHLHVAYNRKITIGKENSDADTPQDKNKTEKSDTNDEIYFKYNKTGQSSSTTSELSISHSSYDHVSSSVVYDEDSDEQTSEISLISETSKVEELKNSETKKKEKGKKDIFDSATVPTDSVGAGKLEKPFKDSLLNSKLKEKIKDSTPEALDDRRSTTSRISSSSVSLSDHDNNKLLGSVELLRVSPPSNNREVVNQSGNSVINVNGVNNDSLKKPKIKTLKKVLEDNSNTEGVHNLVGSSTQQVDVTRKLVAVNSQEITTSSPVSSTLADSEKLTDLSQNLLNQLKLEEVSPTKIDVLKATTSPTTTVIKPSLAFKRQLANKLKGLETVPTASMATIEESEELSKIGVKSSTKFTLRKKQSPLRLDLTPTLDMNIPPTATAWTLASLKSSAETHRSSQRFDSIPESSLVTDPNSLPKPSTIPPVSRVKSFVPWSTRLLRSTSTKPPSTEPIGDDEEKSSSTQETTSSSNMQASEASDSSNSSSSSTTEEQAIIRSTTELDRNQSESSINFVEPKADDVMIKDQSSPTPHHGAKSTKQPQITNPPKTDDADNGADNGSESIKKNGSQVENVKEEKHLLEENESKSKKVDKHLEKAEEIVPDPVINENVNELKSKSASNNNEDVVTIPKLSTVTKTDGPKAKNASEYEEAENPDDNKSGEGSEEEEHIQTTTPSMLEPAETTTVMDLDEDVDVENEREEEELPALLNKTNQSTVTTKQNETKAPEEGSTEAKSKTYTSIDIVSKDNKDHPVTSKPSEGDINWYNVETKPNKDTVEETSEKPIAEATTTVALDTTAEPETTKTPMQETTLLPESITDTVTTMPPSTTEVPLLATGSTVKAEVEKDAEFDNVDDPSSCARVIVQMSPARLCRQLQQLRETIAAQLTPEIVSWEQVLILKPQECENEYLTEHKQDLSVNVCFTGQDELPSPTIRDEFLKRCAKTVTDPNFPIINIQMIMDPQTSVDGFDNVLAAIILSVIAAICLVLLGILLVIVRKRQGKFNYGQRCTPVSLDDYSLDNISVYNSVRRKGALRASKRSYGNPGFDDPGAPTHSINFAGLANFSSDREALNEEFNQIPMITVKPDELPAGAESKNRYANVIPLPETRVILQTKEGADHLEDYINANYVKGTKGQEKLYIACQAPLQSTIEDFWKMVWQEQTKVILMLTALNENGVEKCADYLPQLEITDCHRMFGDFQVTLKKHEVREKYIISSLQLKNLETNLWREVTHLWYMGWPAQGVPEDGSSIIAFLIEARSYMRGAQGPTVVHCSPGTGRTGTVIAIDLCIRDFETLRCVDIPKTVYALRRDRAGCVQTRDQYSFIYQVLNLYATKLTGGALDSI